MDLDKVRCQRGTNGLQSLVHYVVALPLRTGSQRQGRLTCGMPVVRWTLRKEGFGRQGQCTPEQSSMCLTGGIWIFVEGRFGVSIDALGPA